MMQSTNDNGSKLYLVTGATGHVGGVLLSLLIERGERVRALVLPGDDMDLPEEVEVVRGDITKPATLPAFFGHSESERLILIHCAARVTIASGIDPRVWRTNVFGTRNVLRMAKEAQVEKVILVSSVHAIPEKGTPSYILKEVESFSPDRVEGQYAKSKAAAAQIALDFAKEGLPLSIVHPSGVIGPGDKRLENHMVRTILAMAEGKIPAAISGGYDFVDARDVAEGILACVEKGRNGECYILSGHYITVREILEIIREEQGKNTRVPVIPIGVVRAAAPLSEKIAHFMGRKAPIMTPYSLDVLRGNGMFSREKAERDLGYSVRDIRTSILDTIYEFEQ